MKKTQKQYASQEIRRIIENIEEALLDSKQIQFCNLKSEEMLASAEECLQNALVYYKKVRRSFR